MGYMGYYTTRQPPGQKHGLMAGASAPRLIKKVNKYVYFAPYPPYFTLMP